MKNVTVETLADDKHQLNLTNYSAHVLNEICENLEHFGVSRIDEKQQSINNAFEELFKARAELAPKYIGTLNFINELFLFISTQADNAGKFRTVTDFIKKIQ